MRTYRSILLFLTAVLASVAVCFVGAGTAGADPYPPSPCTSSSAQSGGTCQGFDATTISRVRPATNPVTPQQTSGGHKTLAFTGTPAAMIAGVGVTLLLGGTLLVFAARRRPSAH
ncbi:MAG: hypothetical protein ACR2KJ_06185 [Jatrophihabitans sp.]